jgi:hypothetical protein
MSASVVEVVFVIDSSGSMQPCFDGLAMNLERFLKPLQGFKFRIRLGLVALKVGEADGGGRLYDIDTLAGGMDPIYDHAESMRKKLFTDSADAFLRQLRAVSLSGDENNLLAIDLALDFPFGPLAKTRRVVAVFSDERLEDGAVSDDELERIPKLSAKVGQRRVLLFAAMPESPALEALGATDGCHIQTVDGGDGLKSVDFGKLMDQMAKSISVMSMQGAEAPYQRALFGQDKWGTGDGSFEDGR